MGFGNALAVYAVIWLLTLLIVLPWGARSQQESGAVTPGTDPAAPSSLRLWTKYLWVTLIAGVLFGILAAAYQIGLIPPDLADALFGQPPQ